jgi:site-specific DNA-methyltransferase (adenine-specific)
VTTATWIRGDVRDVLPTLPDGSVDLVACSPPFWKQRGYLPAKHPDKAREIGQEASPAAFLDVLLGLTAQFRRLLSPYGSIAIELGDTMANSGGAGGDYDAGGFRAGQPRWKGSGSGEDSALPKSHCMIPEAYRFALVWGINPFTGEPSPAGRWIARNVVDWCRRNPTPGDDGDKFRRATSDIVCATLSPNRWWDGEPVRVPAGSDTHPRTAKGVALRANDTPKANAGGNTNRDTLAIQHLGDGTRPLYDWWDLSSDPYPGAHYAVWPPEVARRLVVTMCPHRVCTTCGEPQRRIFETVNAVGHAVGSKHWITDTTGDLRDMPDRNVAAPDYAIRETVGWTDCGHGTWRAGMVLDPFAGTGTTGSVATGNGRDATLIDLDERNLDLAYDRIGGLFLTEGDGLTPSEVDPLPARQIVVTEPRQVIDMPPL